MPVIGCPEGFRAILIRFALQLTWLHLVSGLATTQREPFQLHNTGELALNLLQISADVKLAESLDQSLELNTTRRDFFQEVGNHSKGPEDDGQVSDKKKSKSGGKASKVAKKKAMKSLDKKSKVKRMKTIMSNVTKELEDDSNETTWFDFVTRVNRVASDGGTSVLIGVVCIGAAVFLAVFIMAEVANSGYEGDDGSMKRGLNMRQRPPSQVQSQASLAAASHPPPTMQSRLMQNIPISAATTQDQLAGRPGSQPGSRPGSRPGSQGGSPKSSMQRMPNSAALSPARGGSIAGTEAQMSARQLSPAGSPTSAPPGNPPAICKELVLPHCEAWFAVSFGHLDTVQSGEFDLYGLSGKPLLRANVAANANATGRVSISMKPPKSPTLGSVTCQVGADGRKQMSIAGKKDVIYGELINQGGPGSMDFVLIHQGTQVVRLMFDPSSGQLMLVAASAGTQLACASKCVSTEYDDIFHNQDHLEVRVNPGVDAVLALLCVMGAVVFGAHGGNDLPHAQRPSHIEGVAMQ